jgi:hypothetical protein
MMTQPSADRTGVYDQHAAHDAAHVRTLTTQFSAGLATYFGHLERDRHRHAVNIERIEGPVT